MSNFKLVSSLIRHNWLMDKTEAEKYMPLVVSILKGNANVSLSEERPEAPLAIVNANHLVAPGYRGFRDEVPENSVGVLPVIGPVLKYGNWCSYGTVDYTRWLKEAEKNVNIKGIILKADSPGGMVDGTQTFVDAIQKFSKPIKGYVDDGCACSAAYWILSACDEIYVSQKTDIVGSIGVFATLYDFRGWFEKEGIAEHIIYADQSEEKNKESRDAFEDNYTRMKERILNPIAQTFINSVQQSRSINTDAGDPFKGAIYMAQEAQNIGLIDGVATLESVATSIIDSANSSQNDNTFNMKLDLKNWFASGDKLEEGQVAVDSKELEKLRADSQAAVTENETLTTERDEWKQKAENAEKRVAELKTANATLTTERDEWKQKAEKYGAQPGDMPTQPTAGTDDITEGADNDMQAIIDNLPHNKALDGNVQFAQAKN